MKLIQFSKIEALPLVVISPMMKLSIAALSGKNFLLQ
jgi:hypothetical protein